MERRRPVTDTPYFVHRVRGLLSFIVAAAMNVGGKSKMSIRAVLFAFGLTFSYAGCAYRLPVPMPPSQQHLIVSAKSPELITLRLRIGEPHAYDVPSDGRVTLDVPSYRPGCSVYLFDKIKLRSGANPYAERTIDVVRGGKTIRQFSLKELATLPVDQAGYHLLALRPAR